MAQKLMGVFGCERYGGFWPITALVLTASLTACGGGGSDSTTSPIAVVDPAITPTPTPTPTQTPTPTPTPTNTSLPATVTETFDTASAKVIATVDKTSGATSEVVLPSRASFGTLSIAYNSNTGGYSVADEASSKVFLPSSLIASAHGHDTYLLSNNIENEKLELFRPSPDNELLPLKYLSYANWATYQDGSATTHYLSRFATYGIATEVTTLPKQVAVYYKGVADGLISFKGRAYRLRGSEGSITVDYASRTVRITLILRGNTNLNSEELGTVAIGTATGIGQLGSTTSRFTGTIESGELSGSLGGSVYGVGAAEAGLSFSMKSGSDTVVGVLLTKQ
jgi:hypothetical protein